MNERPDSRLVAEYLQRVENELETIHAHAHMTANTAMDTMKEQGPDPTLRLVVTISIRVQEQVLALQQCWDDYTDILRTIGVEYHGKDDEGRRETEQ